MKKKCSTCKLEKNSSDFRKDSTAPDGYSYSCKICSRARQKSLYMKNYGTHAKARGKRINAENRANLLEYRLNHPCVNCGESDPVCLDFHHIDPATKSFGMSSINRNWGQLLE